MLTADLAKLTSAQRVELLADLSPQQRQELIDRVRTELGPALDPLRHLTWREWTKLVRPKAFDPAFGAAPFGAHHVEAWEWLWSITRDPVDPLAVLWPRGHAKSTFAETAVVRLGTSRLRKYCLYISGTQGQADDHVSEIEKLLGSRPVETHYPSFAERELGAFGSAKSWNRQRLWTAGGLIVDSLGLDTAAGRGAKLDDERPDMVVFDDVDAQSDSVHMVNKKLKAITDKIMPAASDNAVIVFAQNLIHRGSIANRISTRATDVLADARRSGPLPAIEGMKSELRGSLWHVTGGRPTWEGFGLERAQRAIRRMGYDSFQLEVQQNLDERPGALLKRSEISHIDAKDVPEIERMVVAIDPNKTGRGDDAGVIVIGRGIVDGVSHGYVFDDLSDKAKPSEWRDSAIRAAIKWNAGLFVVEFAGLGEHAALTLQGSDLWKEHGGWGIEEAEAKLGKKDRARPIARLYIDGRIHHVGSLPYLESQWTGWDPEVDSMSPGAVDALVHGATHLLVDNSGPPRSTWI